MAKLMKCVFHNSALGKEKKINFCKRDTTMTCGEFRELNIYVM